MREDYVSISPAQLRAGGQQDVDYILDRPPFTRYFWTGSGFEPVSGANTLFTAAQLSAKATAGTLTPLATYVASDTGDRYWASGAGTLVLEYAGAGNIIVYTTAVSGTSPSAPKPSGMSKVAVSATGVVNYAAIYVEDADTSAIYGAFGAPMSGARWCSVPAGAINIRARVAAFDGTSITVTLAAGV